MEYFNPHSTYQALLIVQALHLIHHRLAKRHISFAEAISGVLLCVPPSIAAGSYVLLLSGAHVLMIVVQVIGSIWIRRLSPDWS